MGEILTTITQAIGLGPKASQAPQASQEVSSDKKPGNSKVNDRILNPKDTFTPSSQSADPFKDIWSVKSQGGLNKKFILDSLKK